MDEREGPWSRKPAGDGGGSGGGGGRQGLLLLLGAVAAFGLLVWFLFTAFPGRGLSMDDTVRLIGLATLFAWIVSGFAFSSRFRGRELLRNVAVWIGIAAVLLIGYSYRHEAARVFGRVAGELDPSRATMSQGGALVLTASRDGHFYATGSVNGTPVLFLIDTGASGIVLSPRDAERAGFELSALSYTQVYNTANGTGTGAPVRLDSLALETIRLHDVRASVNGAEMEQSLLGMAFLRRLSSFEFRGDRLYLRP